MIRGKIDCSSTKEIPVGSVIFVYVFNTDNKKVVGHQTLQNINNFPFEYRVELENKEVQNCALRVLVEQSESTLFYKDNVKLELNSSKEGECDIDLESYLGKN